MLKDSEKYQTPVKPPKEFDAIERKRTGPNQISSLIILDRTVDPVSPLLSPTSYYGLLADELDLKWNSITLKPEDADAKPKKVSLSPDEPINEELSDVHVKHAARIISQKLRTLKAAFDERHDKKTVAEYKGTILITLRSSFRFSRLTLLDFRFWEGIESNKSVCSNDAKTE